MNIRHAIAIGVSAVLVLGVAIAVFLLGHSDESAAGSGDDARAVAAALNRLASDPETLVASAAAGEVGTQTDEAVPEGTKVQPDAESWAPDGAGGGTMSVSLAIPGKGSQMYLAVMVREKGKWKVLATLETSGGAE